jgi:sugar lactone lactonase YvrE
MKTKFKSALGLTCHLFSRPVCFGAVILICSSAAAQNLFVSARDDSGGKILKFTWDGVQSTRASGLRQPQGLAFDSAGNLFVTDLGTGVIGSVIYKFKPTGVARSIFASGLDFPIDLAFDSAGNLFVGETYTGNIYKYTPDGVRTLFASGMFAPASLAFDYRGNLFVVDLGLTEAPSAIYEFKPDGSRSTFAKGEPSNDPSLDFNHLAFQPIATLPPPTPAPRGE